MSTLENKAVPDADLLLQANGEWKRTGSGALFGGKTSVVFALPGAFTPTCSSQHLPRFEELAPVLREHGVDQVLCVAVNDPFVMAEWGRQQGLREVQLVSDGNGDFSRKMGMLRDTNGSGMGARSRRYSMLVRDAAIVKMFAEAPDAGDAYAVSDADTMLDYLAPGTAKPPRVAILTKPGCPYCASAMKVLREHHLRFDEWGLNDGMRSRVLGAMAGATTTPQVFADGRLIGGLDALKKYLDESRSRGSHAKAS